MNYFLSIVWVFLSFIRSDTPAKQAARQATTWTYNRAVDATGSVVYKATVSSPTVLDLGYPYGRGAVATLTLRSKNGSTIAYVEFAKGAINRSFQNGTAHVRFDGQPVRQYPLTAAANGRANIVFIDPDRAFTQSIKRANRTTIALLFAGQPNRELVFPTAGLRWPH